MTIPAYLPYFVFAGTAATVFAILYGLNRALADAAWPMARTRTRAFRVSAVVLLGWLALSIVLAAMGVYHVDANALPTIQFGIVPPILIGMFADLAIGRGGPHPRRRAASNGSSACSFTARSA